MRTQCCCFVISLLALGCLGREGSVQEKANPGADAGADLQAGNAAARNAYRAARERALAECGPIVLWDGDDLVFRYGNYRRVSQPIPSFYHDLKTAGHMVMGLHALLVVRGDAELNAQQLFEIGQFRESVRKVRKAFQQRELAITQRDRQEDILRPCDDFLGSVVEAKKARFEDLRKLLRGLRPLLAENTREAACAQIDGIHREMQRYRAQLSEAEWKKVRVVVQGSQQPRKHNLAVQYFARLLEEPGEGGRIVYGEALFDENKALALLGAKLVDAQLGQDIWNDPHFLARDLLGEAARVYLDDLFSKK